MKRGCSKLLNEVQLKNTDSVCLEKTVLRSLARVCFTVSVCVSYEKFDDKGDDVAFNLCIERLAFSESDLTIANMTDKQDPVCEEMSISIVQSEVDAAFLCFALFA